MAWLDELPLRSGLFSEDANASAELNGTASIRGEERGRQLDDRLAARVSTMRSRATCLDGFA